MNNIIRRMLILIAFFVLVILFFSIAGFWRNIHPVKINIFQQPTDLNLSAKDITLTTDDGLKLSGWLIKKENDLGEDDKKAIVILHGYPAEKSDMLNFAKDLHPYFSILLLDMRYFGKSEGEYTTLGCKEQLDLKAALDFLQKNGFENIGVLGFSLGGAVGIIEASKDQRIGAVAAYAPYADATILGRDLYSFLPGLNYPLVGLMNIWNRVYTGCNLKKDSPLKAAEKLKIPIFITHSQEDEQIPIKHSKMLRTALKNNKNASFYFFNQGWHGEVPLDFSRKLTEFFLKNL